MYTACSYMWLPVDHTIPFLWADSQPSAMICLWWLRLERVASNTKGWVWNERFPEILSQTVWSVIPLSTVHQCSRVLTTSSRAKSAELPICKPFQKERQDHYMSFRVCSICGSYPILENLFAEMKLIDKITYDDWDHEIRKDRCPRALGFSGQQVVRYAHDADTIGEIIFFDSEKKLKGK